MGEIIDTIQPSVLIIDDEEDLLEILVEEFLLENISTFSTNRSTCAIDIIKKKKKTSTPISIVLSDIKMPEMDGVTLCENIKKDFPGIKVYLMTGFSEKVSDGNCKGEIYDKLFQKPFDLTKLINTVKNNIGEKL